MTITLSVTARDKNVKANKLRANGEIPAVVYSKGEESVSVVLDGTTFEKIKKEAGESTLIELQGLDKKTEVLIKDIEFDPVKQSIMHVDFLAIEQGKEMTVTVPLHFEGEAPAEKLNGVVNKVHQEVEVTCQPKDLPGHIEVDLSVLVTLEDKILLKDLKVPTGVVINGEEDESIVVVNEVKEEVEAPVEAVDMDSVEVVEKGKSEEAPAEDES